MKGLSTAREVRCKILATPTSRSTKQRVHAVCIWKVFEGCARFFFYISTIIKKEKNNLVLKNVSIFRLWGLVLPNLSMAASMSIRSLA